MHKICQIINTLHYSPTTLGLERENVSIAYITEGESREFTFQLSKDVNYKCLFNWESQQSLLNMIFHLQRAQSVAKLVWKIARLFIISSIIAPARDDKISNQDKELSL